MAFKMKGSAFKLGGVKGTSGHASALKQTTVGPNYTGDNPNRADQYHPQYNYQTQTIDEKDPGYFKIKGRGKNRRFDMQGDEQGNIHQVTWIRDHYGTNLSGKEKKAAEIAYYNTYKPEEKEVVPEKEQQYTGNIYEKETKYPTNKRTSTTYTGGMPQYEQVWDKTVNNGEGGYVKVDSQGRKEYEEGFNINPTKEDMVIPEVIESNPIDPFADASQALKNRLMRN